MSLKNRKWDPIPDDGANIRNGMLPLELTASDRKAIET